MIEVLSTVFDTLTFTVVKNHTMEVHDIVENKTFQGLMYQEIDQKLAAIVSGRFVCDVVNIRDAETCTAFTVDVSTLLGVLKCISNTYTIMITCFAGRDNEIVIKASAMDFQHVCLSTVPLLDAGDVKQFEFQQWPNHWVIEVDLHPRIKMCQMINSEFVRFRILKHKHSAILGLHLSAKGIKSDHEDLYMKRTNTNHITSDMTGCIQPTNRMLRNNYNVAFDAVYPTSYLHNFTKATERRRVVVRLPHPDNTQNDPLLIYALFGPSSYIAFILASRDIDDMQSDTIRAFDM